MTDTTATTLTLDVPTSTSLVPLRVADRGSGRPVLLLHGGAGPTSVAPLAEALTASYPVRVVTPVHPGFDGTPRPEGVGSVGDLADAYVALLAYGGATMADPTLRARLTGVTVPVRVLWGAHDRIVPPSHGRGYAEAVPGATLRVLDEAGHLPPVEVPEVVAADVWAFAGVHPSAR